MGLIAAAVLATSMRVLWEARWAHIDMLFGCFFLLAVYFGARSLLRDSGKYEILWAYVFMGLAVLAKGLIGIVLPALLLAAFAMVRRDWRIIVDAKLQMGFPIFLLVAAPWFYLVNSATDGKWLADFISSIISNAIPTGSAIGTRSIIILRLCRWTSCRGRFSQFLRSLLTFPTGK